MCHRRLQDCSCLSYMGIHLGEEKLEAIITNSEFEVKYNAVVRYDIDLPEYQKVDQGDWAKRPGDCVVNPVMYVHALDILFNCLASQGANLHLIGAIGCAADHNGAVYWSLAGFRALCGLHSLKRLHEQLTEKCFALPTLYWTNSSIDGECLKMQDEVGGASEMRRITGSPSFAHMTGPEIRKIYNTYPERYEQTIRISLMSSFLASLLIARIASIDYSNGSLMNLMDIRSKQWSAVCLNACVPDLKHRLMRPIAPNQLQGLVGKHLVSRWNFRPDCMVLAATNTSPSLLASFKEQDLMILSLSKTDTIIQQFDHYVALEEGYIMCHPTVPNAYMSLLKFCNGGKVRERVCQEVADGNWDDFNKMLASTPMGNNGCIAVHFDELELFPSAQGTLRWDNSINESSEKALHGLAGFQEPGVEARAAIEGQMMHHCIMAFNRGVNISPSTKIVVTGEYAGNVGILQIIADIFNSPIYTIQAPAELYLLGAAYRARYAFYQYRESNCNCRKCKIRRGLLPQPTYHEFIQRIPDHLKLAASPTPGCDRVYGPLKDRCSQMCRLLAASKPIDENYFMYSSEKNLRPL